MQENKKKRKRILFIIPASLLFCVLLLWRMPERGTGAAAPSLTIREIDYDAETMTIVSSTTDTMLMYSDGKQKKWECAAGSFSEKVYVLDISWVSKTKDYTLCIKGNVSTEITTVVLPKQPTKLKVEYDYLNGSLNFTNAESTVVYWRKNNSTTWYQTGTTEAAQKTMLETFERLYARGATIYFRTGQVKGKTENGAIYPGTRPSKEAKLTIAKQAAAPTISVSVNTQTVTAAATTEYQNITSTTWTTMTSKSLNLTEAAAAAYIKDGVAGKDVALVFRTAATKKKLYSVEKELLIKAQEAAPTNVVFGFANASALSITIEEKKSEDGTVTAAAPSSARPYEYTIVEPNAELKDTAVWTAISTSDAVTIAESKAAAGSTIYVRRKCAVDSDTIFYPASLPTSYVIGEYPSASVAVLAGDATDNVYLKEEKTVVMVKKIGSVPEDFSFRIQTAKEIDTDVKAILCGGTPLEFTTEKSGQYLIVTITSTTKFETATTVRNKAYPLKITLENGEALNDAVTLTILGDAAVSGSGSISVIHSGTDTNTYTFKVQPGYLVKQDAAGEYMMTNVTSVTLMEQELFSSVVQEANKELTVTLSASALQGLFLVEGIETGKAYDLTITMSDGQKITTGAAVTLSEEAVIYGAPYKFVKTVGSNLTESIVVQLTYKTPGTYATNVTWNGINLMGNCSTNSDYILVEMDYQKINALTLSDGNTVETYPVIITLSNGSVVSTGYSLTLQQ